MVVAILAIGVAVAISCTYAGITKDVSGGMSLGALIVAVQAAVFPLAFFYWQYQ
jgi:hypothetical protein